MGECTIGTLCITHVTHPFLIEGTCISIVQAGHREHLGISGPSLSLVTLGTVGGYAQEVAPLSPHHITVELVYIGM